MDWRLSDIAVEWAREVAGFVLDEWQEWLVRWSFVRRNDGLWAARDVGGEVPRQNGKNIWLEVVELVSVFEFGNRLITHSAHRADVSHEHFLSIKEHIQESDELMNLMPTSRHNNGFITTNGNESIELASGARILFKARAKASGRGPRPQKIVFDEALVLEQAQIGSMAPGISAQRNAQIFFASSPPMATSSVLHGLRARALEPEPGDRLFYAAWNNPPGTSVTDRNAWYRVNPSLGYGRMTEDSLQANRKLMDEAEYLREHLGVPEEPEGEVEMAVPLAVWDESKDPDSVIASHWQFALDVSPGQRSAAFGMAGRRDDGLVHVETFDARPGVGWVVGRAVEIWERRQTALRIDKTSPAAAFISRIRERGVEVVEVSTAEHAQACGQFIDLATNGQLRHIGQLSLDSALRGAVLRPTGDADLWARRSSKVDIAPLVAVTLALGGVPAAGETTGTFIDLDDFLD